MLAAIDRKAGTLAVHAFARCVVCNLARDAERYLTAGLPSGGGELILSKQRRAAQLFLAAAALAAEAVSDAPARHFVLTRQGALGATEGEGGVGTATASFDIFAGGVPGFRDFTEATAPLRVLRSAGLSQRVIDGLKRDVAGSLGRFGSDTSRLLKARGREAFRGRGGLSWHEGR